MGRSVSKRPRRGTANSWARPCAWSPTHATRTSTAACCAPCSTKTACRWGGGRAGRETTHERRSTCPAYLSLFDALQHERVLTVVVLQKPASAVGAVPGRLF